MNVFLHMQRVGHSENPALIMAPGWIYPHIEERAFLSLLGSHFYLHLINLPGYAGTPEAAELYSFDKVVEELAAYIEEQHLYTAQLIGFSMGSRLLMQYLTAHNHSGRAVFIGSPTNTYALPLWAKLMLSQPRIMNNLRRIRPFTRYVVERALRDITQDPRVHFESTTVTLLGAFDSLIALLTSRSDWEAFVASGVFVYGEHDRYLPAAQSLQPQRLHVIDGAGHNCVRGNEAALLEILQET